MTMRGAHEEEGSWAWNHGWEVEDERRAGKEGGKATLKWELKEKLKEKLNI